MVHSNGRSGRKLCLKRNLPKSNHHSAEGIPLIPLAPPKLHCTSTCCIHTIKIPVSFLTFLQLTPINACDQWTTFDHLNCTRTLAVAPIATHPIILLLHKMAPWFPAANFHQKLDIWDFTTLHKPKWGKPIQKLCKYLDKVQMDIVFGDSLVLGGVAMPSC